MEYEPEWESAFNLHVKLAHSITLSLEWCASERALIASAYRMALRRHSDIYCNQPRVVRGDSFAFTTRTASGLFSDLTNK